jgi:hypothetical protein
MDTKDILRQLDAFGDARIKKVLMAHGAREPLSGVKVADLKKIQKRVKVDHHLALELFETGHYDAMYLAGLIADDKLMTQKDLERWSRTAYAGISEYTLPWVAAQGRFGWEMGLAWIASKKETVAAAGWMTLSNVVALTPDDALDMKVLASLLIRVSKEIHKAPNRVRAAMNAFMIAVGSYVAPLSGRAVAAARDIGEISVDVGGTACKIPFAPDYIGRVAKRGSLGKKRTTVKC